MAGSAMAIPTILKPISPARVIDLVAKAGIDVSGWAKGKNGPQGAAANPKYCYEWSFTQPGKVVVLNLWYEHMREERGVVLQRLNYRTLARRPEEDPTRRRRAEAMDKAIVTAATEQLPVRVIVLDGQIGGRGEGSAKRSRAERRLLDPESWAVTDYDSTTGDCVVTRGASAAPFADQFSIACPLGERLQKRAVVGEAFVRSPAVRAAVLNRAHGNCELCGTAGFLMRDGRMYLETHHIVPLGEQGLDHESNVAGLCANCHRESHHGAKADQMRCDLAEVVTRRIGERAL
jgi:5-methylcytosine-specific restriction enzyme A